MNNRKRKVLEASRELFIEKGIQNTSIQDIIHHAGISKGTFYNYFTSKNECVLAILEQARYEASLRRNELMIGCDMKDARVLIEQISVLMTVNREKHIFSLFESVFSSQDAELKKIVAHHRIFEMRWLSDRLVDVFGEEARPYAFEGAVLFYGMMQHVMITWSDAHIVSIDPLRVVESIFYNVQAILKDKVQRKNVILDDETLQLLEHKMTRVEITIERVCDQLKGFIECIKLAPGERNEAGEQFASYLLEELGREQPRLFVLENNLKAFHESFIGTTHLAEAKEIASRIWYLLKNNQPLNKEK